MAYENGYDAMAYIPKCIEKYKKDNMIFCKAMNAINVFSNQPEWPHNYEIMKRSVLPILGDDIEVIVRFSQQWIAQKPPTPEIKWPDDINDVFLDDLKSFSYTISDLLERGNFARVNPLRFFAIARSTEISGAKKQKVFRIIRMDGKTFDLELSRGDIKQIQSTLEKVIQDSCELE